VTNPQEDFELLESHDSVASTFVNSLVKLGMDFARLKTTVALRVVTAVHPVSLITSFH